MKKKSPINIIIADDHEFFRKGLVQVLTNNEEYCIIGEASDGEQLINKTIARVPDLVILDILMPKVNGIKATQILQDYFTDLSIIALSMFNEENIILELMNAGAMGFLDKNIRKENLYEAIDTVVRFKQPYFPPTTSLRFFELLADSDYKPYKNHHVSFSPREEAVILLTCKEFTHKEIADELQLSKRTVETHRARIMEKMQVKSVAGLVAFAYSNGMVPRK